MKALLIAALACGVACAASDAKTATALTAEEQLAVAREQIAELQAEQESLQAQLAAARAEARTLAARVKYDGAVQKQREAHSAAPGCDLKTDQSWACPNPGPAHESKQKP